MNLPNILTLLRVILTFVAVSLVCIDVRYSLFIAFFIFFVASSTDWFDGYLARKYNQVTIFGQFMDALCDKILVVSMFLTLFAFNMYQEFTTIALFCAIISMSREFAVSGIRMLAAKAGVVLAAEKIGKYKAALQMFSIGFTMFAQSLVIDFNIAGNAFYTISFYCGIITLIVSTVLSIISGLDYIKRYSFLFKG